MSSCAFSVAAAISQSARSNVAVSCSKRRHHPSLSCSDSAWLGPRLRPVATSLLPAPRPNGTIRCDDSESTMLPTSEKSVLAGRWREALQPGAVIEVWSRGELRFGIVTEPYAKGVLASFVEVSSECDFMGPDIKVSFGEIINVWDAGLRPNGENAAKQLASDVCAGLRLLKVALPRTLDLKSAYEDMRKLPKKDPTSVRTSTEVAQWVFSNQRDMGRGRRAAITVATAILLASDSVRFKRAAPGQGWRALPASVAVARGRCSFVDMCKHILEQKAAGTVKRAPLWSRDHLEILRELEIYAASGSVAKGTAATALEALGYEVTDDGAATMLLDIEYWATGTVETDGGGTTQAADANIASANLESWIDPRFAEISDQEKAIAKVRRLKLERLALNESNKTQLGVRDWTFPPEILAEARELRMSSRERRLKLLESEKKAGNGVRRSLWDPKDPESLRVYCIDDKASRFLDDALSVQVVEGGSVVRIAVHVADVDQVVKSGCAIDELARERGQSLYLPLKPLHMLPAAAMDAASFSSMVPTEAITVLVDFDLEKEVIQNWQVFASIIPPVTRLNYEQFDAALDTDAQGAGLSEEDWGNLRMLARSGPLLAERLDLRRLRRKQKAGGKQVYKTGTSKDERLEAKSIASVRLVKRSEKGMGKGVKVAQVVDFRTTGSHVAVGELLTSAGSLIRKFARENRAHLPEDRGAAWYVARCGTAPLRRYADLAIQRQVKCVLFGRQPAGRRRMDELRLWLAKRQSAGERTVAERRRNALYDSLSNHCAQQCAASGASSATVRGQVLGVGKTKRGAWRVDVRLDGTGLDTRVTIGHGLLGRMRRDGDGGAGEEDVSLKQVERVMGVRSKVRVQIESVDTVARRIKAAVVEVL